MFVSLSRLYGKFFQHVAACAARRREARKAEEAARRRLARYFRPMLEGLEERIVPDAYTFSTLAGGPSVGSYTNAALWTNLTKGGPGVPGAADTADIPTGAVCTLDNSADEQTVGGITIEGNLTVKSGLLVQANSSPGSGTTAVAAGGLLDVTTPDIPNTDSKLETSVLTTAGGGMGGTPNFTMESNSEVDIDSSAILSGTTAITGGLLDAKNINAFSGAIVALAGPGAIGGTGQMEAGINASITFTAGSAWTVNPDSAVDDAFKEGNFFVDGPLAVNSNFNPYGDITLDPSGTIGGTGSLDIGREFHMLGGTLGPAGGTTIEASANFDTNGVSDKILASNLTNLSATTDLNGTGNLVLNPAADYLNETGTTDVELPSIIGGFASSGGTFYNDANGTLAIKTPASSPTTINTAFVNTGTLNTEGGTLTLVAPFAGPDTLDGTLALGDDLTLAGTFTSPVGFVLNAGLGHLKIGGGIFGAGSLDVPSDVTDDILGYLEVTSSGTLSGAGQVYNNGTVEVDFDGTTGIGSYQMGSSGTLKLHAVMPASNSSLAVAGSAELSGNLDMEFDNGYVPTTGNTFTVLTAGSISGHFDSTPPDMTVGYTPISVTLTQN